MQMVDSQLRLTVINAIVVPRAFEQATDHSIIRAYTLNPEGRVMLKASSLILSEVTKGIYDLSRSQPSDALTITASGNLIPYNQHKYLSQRRYYPSIMIVDEISLMSGRIRIPIRVQQMMNEEAPPAASKKSNLPLYSGPLTSSTTIYPGSDTYYDMLSGRGNSSKETGTTTHTTEATSKPGSFIFSGPSLKSESSSSRQGFKKFFDNTPLFRKRTVDPSDDGYLKKARGVERSPCSNSYVSNSSSGQATSDSSTEIGSSEHSHRLPRKASNVKKYSQ